MRKFLMISLALLGFAIDAWSCGYGYYESHNNYMFSVFRREAMDITIGEESDNAFWSQYINDDVTSI